jgi:hypothetical protein
VPCDIQFRSALGFGMREEKVIISSGIVKGGGQDRGASYKAVGCEEAASCLAKL